MKKHKIEIHYHDTTNTGMYKVWFAHKGVKHCAVISENDTVDLLTRSQEEDLFFAEHSKYTFMIAESNFNDLLKKHKTV